MEKYFLDKTFIVFKKDRDSSLIVNDLNVNTIDNPVLLKIIMDELSLVTGGADFFRFLFSLKMTTGPIKNSCCHAFKRFFCHRETTESDPGAAFKTNKWMVTKSFYRCELCGCEVLAESRKEIDPIYPWERK